MTKLTKTNALHDCLGIDRVCGVLIRGGTGLHLGFLAAERLIRRDVRVRPWLVAHLVKC